MEKITHHYHKLRSKSAGLLILRLAVGAIFIYAGWFKLTHMAMVVPMFASMHIPAWLAWTVALIEFVGGISVIVGWWSKFFTGAMGIILIVAMIMTKMVSITEPTGQMHWLLLASLATIFLAGCGRFSACAYMHHRNCGTCKTDGKCGCEHN